MKFNKQQIAKICDKLRKYFIAIGMMGLLLAIANKKNPSEFFESKLYEVIWLGIFSSMFLCLFLYAYGSEVFFIRGGKYDRNKNPGLCNMTEALLLLSFLFWAGWFLKELLAFFR